MSNLTNQSFELQKEAWKKYGLELIETRDGSPTLREKQSMHHLGGALSETDYIYGEILRKSAPFKTPPKALVVGLGLGYIEHLCARFFNKYGSWDSNGLLISYESREDLRELMILSLTSNFSWAHNDSFPQELLAFLNVKNLIEKLPLGFDGVSDLHLAFKKKQYQMRESLNLDSLPNEKFNLIFFDAYSSQASPELWSEKFLENFLEQCADSSCWLSTYACTGVLQRALKKFNFQLFKRPGFEGKRESLLAHRSASTSSE
jgi:hypothetical protein